MRPPRTPRPRGPAHHGKRPVPPGDRAPRCRRDREWLSYQERRRHEDTKRTKNSSTKLIFVAFVPSWRLLSKSALQKLIRCCIGIKVAHRDPINEPAKLSLG